MIPYSTVLGYSHLLGQLTTAALQALWSLLTSADGASPERQRQIIIEAFPELFNPFAATASQVSASFYEEVRALSGVSGTFAAGTLGSVDSGRWHALAGYGTAPSVFEQGGQLLMYKLLSGGLTSALTEAAADTIVGNAAMDSVPVGFQRVPAPGCCAFCGMLASRGVAYSSEESALRVVGRGVPVPRQGEARRRGGIGKGIQPRGSRALGQEFHDHCKCRAVPVHAGNYVQMQADADKYFDAYVEARSKVNSGLRLNSTTHRASDGSLTNTYEWLDENGAVSPEQKTRNIVAAMRHEIGVN